MAIFQLNLTKLGMHFALLFAGIDTGKYRVIISGPQHPIKPRTQVLAHCRLQPLIPNVKLRWLNAQSVPVSDTGILLIQAFNTANEGIYTCEALFPDGNSLRNVCANYNWIFNYINA